MFTLITALILLAGDCPMHAEHMHAAEVDSRGDQAMGFSHDLTKHAFTESDSGGSIDVTATSADDAKSVAAIRGHLQSIAKEFANGDFAKPEFIHGRMPDGARVMIAKKGAITYKYEEVPSGGRVVMTTRNAEAIAAIHDFLKFQAKEHRTGSVSP